MTPEEEAEFLAEQAANASRAVIPQFVSRRKAVKLMRRIEWSAGVSLYDHIIAMINTITDPQTRSDAMDDFLESQQFERYSPQTVALATLAGISSEQLDTFFTDANNLP